MKNYKLTAEELAKIVAVQMWGISQQTDNPIPPMKVNFFVDHYKKAFNQPNLLGNTLAQLKKINDLEKKRIEELEKASVEETKDPSDR